MTDDEISKRWQELEDGFLRQMRELDATKAKAIVANRKLELFLVSVLVLAAAIGGAVVLVHRFFTQWPIIWR